MQDPYNKNEIDRAREEATSNRQDAEKWFVKYRESEHKLRLKTIAYRHASALLWLILAHGLLNLFISNPTGKAILAVAFLVSITASGVISYRAGKRAKKEYGK